MKEFQGIWFPDEERHFPEWMAKNGQMVDGKGTYQYKKWLACLPHIKNWRTAVDVGGHVGLWSLHMHKKFSKVHAFEPVPEFRECFVKNVSPEVLLYSCALGSIHGFVRMSIDPQDTGGTHVDPSAESGAVPLRPLDEFDLQDVDFIKIDCEGYELQVLHGAVKTIERCKPCIIVEQKPHKLLPNFGIKGTPAVDYLKGMGAVVRKELSGDYICSW